MKKWFSLTISLFLLLSPVAIAEENPNQRVYQLSDFSGGLATFNSEYALPDKYATIAENIRFDSKLGAFIKRDSVLAYGTADTSEKITGMHRLYLSNGTKKLIVTHGDEIESGNDSTGAFTNILNLASSDYRWQWVTWHDIAIGTDGYNNIVKYDGTSASATYLGSCLATDAGSGAGPNGTYTYKVAFYTTSYTVCFNIASNPVTVVDNDINLTMIPIAPATFFGEDVIGRKIYRIVNAGSTYKLLSNGTIADNTTTTLTDSDADGALGANLSPDYNYSPPKGKLILVHKNRLFIANDPSYPSRVYYSEDGLHDYFEDASGTSHWNILQNDGDEITFMKNLLGVLTIGKNNNIIKLYTRGDDPITDWAISDPFSSIGCQSMYSAVNSDKGIMYLHHTGIYNFNGQYSTLVSGSVKPEIDDISVANFDNCWAEMYRGVYHLAYTSESTGESTNNRILLFDTINNIYTKYLIFANAFCTFKSGTDWDVLYYGSSANGKVYAFSESLRDVVHNKHSDFTGTWDDMGYVSINGGGDADSPVIELMRTETIDELSGTINALTGIIDREDTDGTYTSQVMQIKPAAFNKLYWNEIIPTSGSNVLFYLRTGATSAACQVAAWSSSFTNPAGSDISSITANDFLQYKIALSTDNILYTPTVYNNNNYVVRITYNAEGSTDETTIPIRRKSGWLDFGAPGRLKNLKKIECYYKSESTGTLKIKIDNFEGDSDTFEIDLGSNPSKYEGYFNTGYLPGKMFSIDIQESSLKDFEMDKIILVYDIEQLI